MFSRISVKVSSQNLAQKCAAGNAKHFHTTVSAHGRIKPNIKLRAPIAPTVKNIKVKDDHPLWQFFHNKKLLRSREELEMTNVRAWTIPELRRKNFNDLHSLWFNCLKERNSLAREARYLESLQVTDRAAVDMYETRSDEVRNTMWRIRHVLSERQHAFENAQEVFPAYKQKFLDNFKTRYLEASEAEQSDLEEQLQRLNWAVFGVDINSAVQGEDFKVNQAFADCVIYNANLRLEKFGTEEQKNKFLPFNNSYDAFPLFTANTEKSGSLENQLEIVENNREKEDYQNIVKLVPAKQVEHAILSFGSEEVVNA